jgi:hypothetical protein
VDETFAKKIIDYANTRQLRITRKLGSGNQGLVYAALQHGAVNEIAVKFHREPEAYLREKRVYERLALHAVSQIEGFNVPELVLTDDAWLVLHLTIVPKPYVLDFGGAYLDGRPEFSDEIWEQWLHDKSEMFEDRWPMVEKVMFGFRLFGIYLMDIHPRNIAFLDEG